MRLIELLEPLPGERILLLGGVDGEPADHLLALADRVVGIDTRIEGVVAARRRGLDARVGDAHHLRFEAEFDVVLSGALHWIKRADDMLAGVWRALRPGGRFVAEAWAGERVSIIVAALEGALRRRCVDPSAVLPRSFHFLNESVCRARLESAGFRIERLSAVAEPAPPWLATAGARALAALRVEDRPGFLAEVHAHVQRLAGYGTVRLRVVARKPTAPPS